MNTYTTEYTDDTGTWVQADIYAWDLDDAERMLDNFVRCGLYPPGTEVKGEMEDSYDYNILAGRDSQAAWPT